MELTRSHFKAQSPVNRLLSLVQGASSLRRTARKHRQSLTGRNFYANKLASLRADAVNELRNLSDRGDTSKLSGRIDTYFSAAAKDEDLANVGRDLIFQLKTSWVTPPTKGIASSGEELFPISLLMQTRRKYLLTITTQMNGSYGRGCYDAAAVMMRRLLEVSIIEAFEGQGLAANAKNPNGEFLQLSDLIDAALREDKWNLSRNTRAALPKLRDVGHLSAHGRHFTAQKTDIEKVQLGCRVAIEEFLQKAGVL